MRFLTTPRIRAALAALLAAVLIAPAWAQMRIIPQTAKRGELQPATYPVVSIDGKALRLAPGALIFDTNNRTILYGYLPANADVAYTQDQTGHVMRVYLLTPHEAAQFDRRKK